LQDKYDYPFTRATSLGGVESLIEHRASIEGPQSTTPQGLLRTSIGPLPMALPALAAATVGTTTL
jgi:hypothetical protein